jgi:CHAT domain-containing protein/Tfp pilus assembly protein PilF
MLKKILPVLVLTASLAFSVTICLASAPLFVSKGLGNDRQKLSQFLLQAYKTSPGDFWSAFDDNEGSIDGPVLFAVMDEAARMKDTAFVASILEAARKKKDQKALAQLTMEAADLFLFIARPDESSKLHDSAMPLARSTEDPNLIARSYEGAGDIALYQGNPATALLMYKKAAELSGNPVNKAVVVRKIADIYVRTGDKSQASKMLDTVLSIFVREKNPQEQANTYLSIAYMAMAQRDDRAAIGALDLALVRYTASSSEKGQADVLHASGEISLKARKTEEAGEYFTKALALYEKTGFLIGEAYALKGLADTAYSSGKTERAADIYKKSLDIFKNAGYQRGQADILGKLGTLNLHRGSVNTASEMYETALPVYRKLKDPLGQAYIYKGLGDAAYYTGSFARALDMYDRALPYYIKSDEPSGQGYIQRTLGDIYFHSHDYAGAMEYYENALKQYIKANVPLEQAHTYRSMARVYLKLQKNDHALAMFNSAMALYRKTGDLTGQGDVLRWLGEGYLRKGNRMGALDMFREALRLFQSTHAISGQGHAFRGIGDVYLAASDLENALVNYNHALNMYRQVQDIKSEGYVLFRIASVFQRKNDVGESVKSFDKGLAAFNQASTRSSFPEPENDYTENAYEHYENIILFMIENENNEKVFQYVESMKARFFIDQLVESRVDLEKGIDPVMKKDRDSLENEFFAITRRISEESRQKIPDKDSIERLKKKAARIRDRLEVLRREITYKSPLYASVLHPEPIPVKSFQDNVLRENEVFAQYFFAGGNIYCLVAGKRGIDLVELPADRKDLILKIRNFLANITNHRKNEPFHETPAQDLYNVLVKPIEPFIEDKSLIISPQGILAYLPFDALLTGTGGEKIFALEKYAIHYIQSGTALGIMRSHYKTGSSQGGFVGFGDPVYDDNAYMAGLKAANDRPSFSPGAEFSRKNYTRAGGSFSRLDRSGESIEELCDLYKKQGNPAQKYLRLEASEKNARISPMENYSHIHFSAHGILGERLQAIALSQIPGDKDDGFLTLGKFMNSRFNAQLVVLAGCETARQDPGITEGVTAMTRAVMYAGSPAALLTLWSVPDDADRDLMLLFYNRLIDGAAKPDALRTAKLDLLTEKTKKGFSHPFFWSGFMMYGE